MSSAGLSWPGNGEPVEPTYGRLERYHRTMKGGSNLLPYEMPGELEEAKSTTLQARKSYNSAVRGQGSDQLDALPGEQRRLVEGYRKGLYPDFIMREEMDRLRVEHAELEGRGEQIERRLSLLNLTRDQERMVRALVEGIRGSLDDPDFARKQQLLRLLVEKVCHQADTVEVHTVIPLGEQLHPLHREGARG